jgi:DNA-binding transcriptional regulator YiaG
MTPAELKSARKRLGMTQRQLAEALRLKGKDPTATVRAWENERRPITGPVQVAVELMLASAPRPRLDRMGRRIG